MKNLLIIMVLTTITVSCKKESTCIDPERANPHIFCTICTMEYDPVCGCDGVTYSNECHAGANGVISYKRGACKK